MSSKETSRALKFLQNESEIQKLEKAKAPNTRNPSVSGSYINTDRTVKIPVETSIKYVESEG